MSHPVTLDAPTDPAVSEALAPVAAALLASARADAEVIRGQAAAEAEQAARQAREHAAEVLERARAHGRAEAELLSERTLGQARREANTALQQARRKAYDAVCEAVRAAVGELLGEDGGAAEASLRALAAATANGRPVKIERDPRGGVVAEAPGVRIDASLDALVSLAIEEIGPAIRRLWTP